MTKVNFLDYYVDFVGTIQPTAGWHLPTDYNKVTIIVEPPLKDIFRDVEKAPKYEECKLHTLFILFLLEFDL